MARKGANAAAAKATTKVEKTAEKPASTRELGGRVTTDLKPEILAKFKALCEARGQTLSETLRFLVAEWILTEERRRS